MSRKSHLAEHLLEMISAKTEIVNCAPALSDTEWRELAEMARQHRLEPALHDFVQSSSKPSSIPDDLRHQWANAYRTATIRSLKNHQSLIKIDRLMGEIGVPYAALKGSWLASHAYAHPALRPMRDVDILVPAARAIEVFDALITSGFARMPRYDTPLEIALATQKHLPPIRCPMSDVVVEIHTQIFAPRAGPLDLPESIKTDRLLERRVRYPIGDVQISFLSSTDSLLHLIIHAAYDHVFNNGPLLIGDVALLLGRASIDWERFWSMAEAGGWWRGCGLVLHLAGRYHALPAIRWPHGVVIAPPDEVAAAALDLMFQDDALRAKIVLVAEMNSSRSLTTLLALLWSRMLPPNHVLTAYGGVPCSARNIWWLYPSWLASKSLELARTMFVSGRRHDAVRTKTVMDWQQRA